MPSTTRDLLPDELPPHAQSAMGAFYEEGDRAGSVPAGSTHVGWTVRDSNNRVQYGFGFLINPQGIGRTEGTRTQLQAVRSGFFIDDFGPAPTAIVLRQLVASGKEFPGGFYTAREDVQRFYQRIWLPATRGPNRDRLRVYFHDHHWDRGFEERIYFPANGLQVERSVDQHNVWRVELQMISLEQYPYAEIKVQHADARTQQGMRYVVKVGDTLDRIARRLAGKNASSRMVKAVIDRILNLNSGIAKTRVIPGGGTGKPMRVYPGEILRLPAR